MIIKNISSVILAIILGAVVLLTSVSAQIAILNQALENCAQNTSGTCVAYIDPSALPQPTFLGDDRIYERKGTIFQGEDNADSYAIYHAGGPLEIVVIGNLKSVSYSFINHKGFTVASKTNNSILSDTGRPLCNDLPAGKYTASIIAPQGKTPYLLKLYKKDFCG